MWKEGETTHWQVEKDTIEGASLFSPETTKTGWVAWWGGRRLVSTLSFNSLPSSQLPFYYVPSVSEDRPSV